MSPTNSILIRDLVRSSIALILLRKRHIMSVIFLTVVDVCGRFCRQTADAVIDTVTNDDQDRARAHVEIECRVSPTPSVLVKKKMDNKGFQR